MNFKFSKSIISIIATLVLLLSFSQNLFSQEKDTLWTRDVWPLTLINGVFSPDDQFIYATCLQNNTDYFVRKYNSNGDLISEIDTIGGIRQFSEDGQFFWNYFSDKYDANTFKKLNDFATNKINLYEWPKVDYWDVTINTRKNIGIGTTWHGIITSTESTMDFDSNIVIFSPSDSKIIKVTSNTSKRYRLLANCVHPDGQEVAYVSAGLVIDEPSYFDTVKIEIWNIKENQKLREIYLSGITDMQRAKLKYSPDGSVLGYQHDGKLTLYSTTDYSVVWESDFGIIMNFGWSSDTKYFYINSFPTNFGLSKYTFPEMKKIYLYPKFESTKFINFNKDNSLILCSYSTARLYLLDNTVTSVADPVFTENYKTSIIQNQTNSDLILSINAIQPNIAEYTITNSLGKICSQSVILNLEQGQNNFEINLSNLNSGIYFLNLTIDNYTHNLKFMVVR